MTLYDRLYELYAEFDTETLRAYREFVDLFPPLDSRVALDRWDEANSDLADRRERIERAFGDGGSTLAEVGAMADRESSFTALDLHGKYGRAPNALVLDVDETLRSAGDTDNEIPRETLHLLTEFVERGVPLVICTGQTLENVKGFLIQGLGNELVHSGDVSVVYEAGAGVFTPGSGADTKRLLYDDLAEDVRGVVDDVRDGVLREAPERVRRGCHLQGNEFNVTLKPNYETGSDDAEAVIDEAMVHLLDLVGGAAGERLDLDGGPAAARAYYAADDPEIAGAIDRAGATADGDVPDAAATLFDRLEVALYRADAAELAAADLHKAAGVEASLDVLGVDDPFVCVMGDSKSDLRVMEWADESGAGVAAAPEHSSRNVLDHVRATDDLVFAPGAAADVLRTMYAWRCLADLNGSE
ncbi:HAD family hydrolase [Halobaculum gomorrense]|uniref:Hydroxymethylpyrimidine pyrophosphatase n=1 Tax=Halobaculum gomorrense TaxID=43928 RepID=A0A1M5RFD3_9EURY|nr:HAD family hydrolase [Halobaculum gomorrense]SHH24840.1 Hydroxymethylpyrimidine pyrophosphatase [Halobaculum gomorrense]